MNNVLDKLTEKQIIYLIFAIAVLIILYPQIILMGFIVIIIYLVLKSGILQCLISCHYCFYSDPDAPQ
jgi:hypothetical protein